jgi:hypothetical protein
MLDAKKKVIEFCKEIVENAKLADILDVQEKAEIMSDSAKEQELIVPVVGGFSAGKSTLINNIIGLDILPAGITPETSLATELHYSPEEFIEAVKKDGSTVRYKTDEINTVKDKAADYIFAKLYLNNKTIKEIEPLVLVDMPGFDSPLDQHNKAINEYISKGCHYIVLSSIEEGTISKSLLGRLQFIDNFERSFSLYLSKSNLRPEKIITDLVSHYKETILDHLDIEIDVVPIGNSSGKEVSNMLQNIDVNKLFFNLYRNALKELCYELSNSLSIRINATKTSLESNNDIVREMEDSILKIQRKSDGLVKNIESNYSDKMVNSVVNNDVGGALDNSLEEIINIAASGEQEAVSRRMNEIINNTLMVSIKDRLGNINSRIASDFSGELVGLDRIMKDCAIDESYAQGIADNIQLRFSNFQLLASKLQDPRVGGTYKTITGILAMTTKVVHPAVELIIFILPTILGPIINFFQKQKQRETLRQKFLTEVFPEIKLKLYNALSTQLSGQIEQMVKEVREQFEEKINIQRAEVDKAIELKKQNASDIQNQIAGFENVLSAIKTILEQIKDA